MPRTEHKSPLFEEQIMAGIIKAIRIAAEKELEKAKDRLDERVAEIVAKVGVNLSSHIEIHDQGYRIIIEVKQEKE